MDYEIHLGYPGGDGQGGGSQHALLKVTRDQLVLNPDGRDAVVLRPEEVVEFRLDGKIPHITQAIVLDHVAFDKIGNVVFFPLGETCKQFLSEIRLIGFTPTAMPAIPWEPGMPPPWGNDDEQ